MSERKITAIFGMEPLRDQESPTCYIIGSDSWAVGGVKFKPSRIERREDNFGDHGLLWFDVFDGDRLACSMQGWAVAQVHYGTEES